MKSPTIYDVANRAGVSISTVSLALNHPQRVSAASRQRVLAAVDALGFQPKSESVSRARRGVGRVGVIAAFTNYSSFHARLDGILEGAAEHRSPVEVVLFDHPKSAGSADPLVDTVPVKGQVDGLIVMGAPVTESAAQRIGDLQMPCVLVDSGTLDPRFPTVEVDDYRGGVLAAEHLLTRGMERFIFLGEAQGSEQYVSQSQLRFQGFSQELARCGFPIPDTQVALIAHTVDEARRAVEGLLMTVAVPFGLFAHSDVLAAGAIRAVGDRGLLPGRDVAVVGYDDSELAEALDLTSVRQPLRESGRVAVRLLLDELQQEETTAVRNVQLKVSLVPRGSTVGTETA